MAKHVFVSDLSVKGIKKMQKDLLKYKTDYLPKKCRELAGRLIAIGVTVSKAKIDESPLGKYVSLSTDISSDAMGTTAILVAVGENKESEDFESFNTLLAIEFGAGIHHNPKGEENPKSDDLGFGVGTFPGQMHAFDDGWYYWDDSDQKWKYTHGVKATMPMYEASLEIINSVVRVAREVFG